jgi:hypothetical protein
MRVFAPLALIALSVSHVLTQAAPPVSVRDDTPFLLAVLNRDGLALPFAAFNGRKWVTPWPMAQTGVMPITIDDVDKDWWGVGARPERLTAWWNGAKGADVKFTALTQVRSLCSARLGLRTDYKSRELAPPRMKQPYPKDGLLVSSDVPVGKIDIVERASPDAQRMPTLITEEFNKMEKRAIRSFGGWEHPIPEQTRNRTPITVEAVYRAPSDEAGWTTYFVESSRQYPARLRDGGCGLTTTGQGWVHLGPGGRVKMELVSRVTFCDRKGVGFMLPFGTVRAGGKTYWIYQYSGYDDEFYSVVRPEPGDIKVVVGYHAGSCPE